MVQETKRNLRTSKMKIISLASLVILTGCATADTSYLQYLDHKAKLAASQNAAEAACLLVIAEGMKNSDQNSKILLSNQIDRCKKEPIEIEPPKNWLGL